jgi:hypothetical protein
MNKEYKYVVFMDDKKDIIVIPTDLEKEFKANGVYTGQLTELERGIFNESDLKEGQTNYLGCLFAKKDEWENIKSLSNDQLYIAYQEAKVNFRNAIEGSQEEIEADRIFTALSLEVESREDFDWLEYKLAENEQNKDISNSNMKGCNNIVKSLLVGCVITVACLVNGISANAQDVNNYDVEIQNVNHLDNSITIQKDNDLYKFYVDDINNYYPSEMINTTMYNDKIVNCSVLDKIDSYSNVSIIYADNEVCCVRIDDNVYDFSNDDGSYKVNDKVNIVMQDDRILQVIPCK